MNKNLKILLVEDEVISAMLMKAALKTMGYEIANHVTTGEKAIETAKSDYPDVILMDIRLADKIDGIEAAIAIKSEIDIPVVYVTGYDDASIRERASKTNPLAFLTKPLSVLKLKKILDESFS